MSSLRYKQADAAADLAKAQADYDAAHAAAHPEIARQAAARAAGEAKAKELAQAAAKAREQAQIADRKSFAEIGASELKAMNAAGAPQRAEWKALNTLRNAKLRAAHPDLSPAEVQSMREGTPYTSAVDPAGHTLPSIQSARQEAIKRMTDNAPGQTPARSFSDMAKHPLDLITKPEHSIDVPSPYGAADRAAALRGLTDAGSSAAVFGGDHRGMNVGGGGVVLDLRQEALRKAEEQAGRDLSVNNAAKAELGLGRRGELAPASSDYHLPVIGGTGYDYADKGTTNTGKVDVSHAKDAPPPEQTKSWLQQHGKELFGGGLGTAAGYLGSKLFNDDEDEEGITPEERKRRAAANARRSALFAALGGAGGAAAGHFYGDKIKDLIYPHGVGNPFRIG